MRLRFAKGDRALAKACQQWVAACNGHSEPPSDASRDQTGIAEVKTARIYKGRPASIDAWPTGANRRRRASAPPGVRLSGVGTAMDGQRVAYG